MSIAEQLVTSYQDRPQAALLMSGSGSNAEAILSNDRLRDLYDFVVIASDNSSSNAIDIASRHGISSFIQHQDKFSDSNEREVYFDTLGDSLAQYGTKIAIYAGFMKIASQKFCDTFLGVNVHPADLTIVGDDRLPKYRGMRALPAMRADLGIVRSTVHVVDNPVDSGTAISLSESLSPPSSVSDIDAHDLLKKKEHAVYSLTLELLGLGELKPSDMPYSYEQLVELRNE